MTPRPQVLALALVLTAAGLVATPAADAAPTPTSTGTIALTSSFSKGSGATCAINNSGESPTPKKFTDDQRTSQQLTSTSQTTNSGDANDVTNASVSTSATVSQKVAKGQLSSLDVSVRAHGTVKAGESSSACASSSGVSAIVSTRVNVPADGFIVMDFRTSGGSIVEAFVTDDQTTGGAGGISAGGAAAQHARVFVTKGTADVGAVVQLQLPNPITTDPITRAGTLTLHATFVRAGAAAGRATGPGAAYVAFPQSTLCMGHQLTLTLKPAAAKASAVSFFVNGRLAKKVAHPAAGKRVAVSVPFRKDAVVSVAVTRNGQILRGKRTYTACSL